MKTEDLIVIEGLKNFTVLIASFVGMYVAIQGLIVWKKQISGRTKFELARDMLKDIYLYRNLIKRQQDFKSLITEVKTARDAVKPGDTTQIIVSKINRANFTEGWREVTEQRSRLELHTVEAQVFWSTTPFDSLNHAYKLEEELRKASYCLMLWITPDNSANLQNTALQNYYKGRDLLDLESDDTGKLFLEELNEAIKPIENRLIGQLKLFM